MKAEHSDLEITSFLKVVRLCLLKVYKELETADGDSKSFGPSGIVRIVHKVVKHKMASNAPNDIITSKFVKKVQEMIDKNHRKSINTIANSRFQGTPTKEFCMIEVVCDTERVIHVCKDKRKTSVVGQVET